MNSVEVDDQIMVTDGGWGFVFCGAELGYSQSLNRLGSRCMSSRAMLLPWRAAPPDPPMMVRLGIDRKLAAGIYHRVVVPNYTIYVFQQDCRRGVVCCLCTCLEAACPSRFVHSTMS